MRPLLFFLVFYLLMVSVNSYASSSDVEGICLGYGFSIYTQHDEYETIDRDGQWRRGATTFIAGKIREYGIFGNGSVFAGYVENEGLVVLPPGDTAPPIPLTGPGAPAPEYFVINFRNEDVREGLTKEEAVKVINEITRGYDGEIVFKKFDKRDFTISDLMKPCSELQYFRPKNP